MKKTILILLATSFMLSLSAQENAQESAAISPDEVLITKKTAVKGCKLAGLGAIALASAYVLYKNSSYTHYLDAMLRGIKFEGGLVKQISEDEQLKPQMITSFVAGFAAYTALKKAKEIIKS